MVETIKGGIITITCVEEQFSCDLIKKIQQSEGIATVELTQAEKKTIIVALAMWNATDRVLDKSLGLI